MTAPMENLAITDMDLKTYIKPDDRMMIAFLTGTSYDSAQVSQSDFLKGIAGLAKSSRTESLTGDVVLVDTDPALLFFDPNGADRVVELAAEADTNHSVCAVNTGSANTLTFKDDGGVTIIAVAFGEMALIFSNGIEWIALSGGGGGGSGDVVGPASAVDENITVFDSTTGKLIKDSGVNISDIPTMASQIGIEELGTATYDDIQDWLNITQSAGKISGWVVSDGGSGMASIAAGKGFIKILDDEVATTKTFDLGAFSTLALINNSNNWIYVTYNAGTPMFATTADLADIDFNTEILIGQAWRENTTVHVTDAGPTVTNLGYRTAMRAFELHHVARCCGLITGETGTRNISMTEGSAYYGTTKLTYSALDTSVADTFRYWYHSAGTWTSNTSATQINNTQYDNGTNLATLSNNQYGCHWVFLGYNGDLHILYGEDSYTLAEAGDAAIPASLPDMVNEFAFIIGKIIILKNASSFTEITSAFEVYFGQSLVTNHNDAANIQGGTTDEYYHTTSAQHTVIGNTSGTNTGDQDAGDVSTVVASFNGVLSAADTDVQKALDTIDNHKTAHQNAGADEINVGGLSGELADDQPPKVHKATHQNGGIDEINVGGLSGELADNQPPKTHQTSHNNGGSDPLKLDDLATPDDNTDLDVSTTKHGLVPKLSNTSTQFLNGVGAWATPAGGTGILEVQIFS